ncbi:purine nucleosidase [Cellulosimicrobium cellulans]|uniref:uridine-preferring nucleoside hydrolase UriH n=1 Tax=Cellulosimicrobium cellulans TaxID=1710 RepID=UPI00195ACE12|nr:nucleoside hydrolase [Cellulosimicrobium cellulans]MBM7821088.1 purine nucleosidase [Cellulosimicrobium cellulans]
MPTGRADAPRRVLLDCDPGHDDAIAMLLAHGSPVVDLVAVTTVAGNQTLEKVTRNALAVAELAGIDAPVAAGCDRPLVRPRIVAPEIHGDSGMDGPVLPSPRRAVDRRHAVDLIVDTVMGAEPGEITLVPTGPLTNVAMAARKEPRIVPRVREVVMMGGGYHVGNRTPVAEFNVLADPEAAHVVLDEPWPVTMVGLDLTHQAVATPDVRDLLSGLDTAAARFVGELLDFYGATYRSAQGFLYPPVHDPCAVAYVIDPEVMTTRRAPLDVELHGALTTGMTVADLRGDEPAPDECRTQVAVTLDHTRFWDLVLDALRHLPA